MAGIFGDYNGSCIACLKGTDTGLAFQGELEWLAAALIHLGIPKKEAAATISDPKTPLQPIDGDHRYQAVFRVCETCVANTVFAKFKPVVLMNGVNVPIIGQVN